MAGEVYVIIGPVHPAQHSIEKVCANLLDRLKAVPQADYAGFSHEVKGVEHQFLLYHPRDWQATDIARFFGRNWGAVINESLAEHYELHNEFVEETEADGRGCIKLVAYAPGKKKVEVNPFTDRIGDLLDYAAKMGIRK